MADIYYYEVKAPIRWDQVAYLAYGNVGYTPDLINANPDMPCYDVLPLGSWVICPYIPEETNTPLLNQLPPWKQ